MTRTKKIHQLVSSAWRQVKTAWSQGFVSRVRLESKHSGLKLDTGVCIRGEVKNLCINGDVHFHTGSFLHLGGQDWCRGQGHLKIGSGAVFSPNCVLFASGPGGIRIGKNFDCGAGVGIFASQTNYNKGPGNHLFGQVNIGDDVIVFSNAVIGIGVTIGDGATVAANSVVTSDVPPSSLVAGSPAEIVEREVR